MNTIGMENTKIKVGQTVDFEVPFTGEPPPDVTWTFNGYTLKPSANITISTTDKVSCKLHPLLDVHNLNTTADHIIFFLQIFHS